MHTSALLKHPHIDQNGQSPLRFELSPSFCTCGTVGFFAFEPFSSHSAPFVLHGQNVSEIDSVSPVIVDHFFDSETSKMSQGVVFILIGYFIAFSLWYMIVKIVTFTEMEIRKLTRHKKWDVNDPEVRRMVEQVKWEIAQEYGIQIPSDGYLGHIVSKDLGKIGSQLQKRIPLLLEWQEKQAVARKQTAKKSTATTRRKKK